MIKFHQLHKSFGEQIVLRDINLEVEGGEFVSLVGPSGAGKTTLFHLLLGADQPTRGTVSVDNFELHKLSGDKLQKYRSKIGVVFQDYKLLPQKTVFENVAFALQALLYDEKVIEKMVLESLQRVGLARKKNSFPHELSGGEKQRIALARALVHNPKLLIADEPTGNLDPDSADDLMGLLLKVNKEGTTIILATHNDRIVDKIKKRVVHLQGGKIVSDKAKAGYR